MARRVDGLPQINIESTQKTEAELLQEQEKAFFIDLFNANGLNVTDIENFEEFENAILKFTKDGVNYETSLRFSNARGVLVNALSLMIKELSWADLVKKFPKLYLETLQIKGEIYPV